jgi:hypothetical protein
MDDLDPNAVVEEPPVTPPADPAPSPEPVADPVDDGEPEPPAFDFDKDWRSALSKGDPDLLKFLGRYQSPDSAIKKFKEINDDIKAGKYKKPLGDDATDEEKAAARREAGIPDEPDGYLATLPKGLVVGEDDKPFVDEFLKNMHGAEAPPAMVNAALDTYYGIVQRQVEEQAAKDDEADTACVTTLKEEWGADFKRNKNVVNTFLDGLPSGLGDVLRTARGADGVPLGMKPEFITWLTGEALERNPLSTVVPGAGANQASAIADEIEAIEKTMRTNRTEYNRDEKMQARYRDLIAARLKLEGKS